MNKLMKNPLDRDIVILLTVSNLPPLEKKIWLNMLPDMTAEEKEQLKKNLEEEVMYETEMSKEAIKAFADVLAKGV